MPDLIDYEAVLADLEAKKLALEAAIAGIRQVVNLNAATATATTPTRPPVEPSTIESDTFFGMGIGDGAKKFLRMTKRKQPAARIAEALEQGGLQHTSKTFPNTVRTTLIRLEAEGEVVQVGKDWGLAEWYPGYRKKGPSQKATDASDEAQDDQQTK